MYRSKSTCQLLIPEFVPLGFGKMGDSVVDVETMSEYLVNEQRSKGFKPPAVLEKTESTIAFVMDSDGYAVELKS